MPLAPVDRADVERYVELGVHRLVLRPFAFDDPDELARFLDSGARLVIA